MKRSILIFAVMLLMLSVVSMEATNWKKYSATSFSFHYPVGWEVKEQDSNIEISNAKTNEQLLIVGVPFDKTKSATQLAKQMVALFKQGVPDISASGFRENNQDSVYFESTYTEQKIKYRAEVLVVKNSQSAYWFSYCAPIAGYNQEYAIGLLQNFVSTIASGSSSKPPAVPAAVAPAVPVVSLEKNARSFLFVLEFALGAPLNHAQEKVILDKLLTGWKTQSPDSLKKFDAYPQLVALILASGQHELEKLRLELEKSIREWLQESYRSDPVVGIVRNQLQQSSKIVAAGSPSLTEMAAVAYSEMTAFAELLADNSKALPTDISSARVDRIRGLLLKCWGQFSAAERSDVLTTPGLWLTFRTLIQFGSPTEKEKIRGQLLKLVPSPSQSSSTNSSGSRNTSRPMSMIEHNVLMNINQMTFNSYLWSRGF